MNAHSTRMWRVVSGLTTVAIVPALVLAPAAVSLLVVVVVEVVAGFYGVAEWQQRVHQKTGMRASSRRPRQPG